MFCRSFRLRSLKLRNDVCKRFESEATPESAKKFETKTVVKSTATLNEDVEVMFENELRHRKHPGVRHQKCIELPALMATAVHRILERHSNKSFRLDAEHFRARMRHKKLPYEEEEIREFTKEFKVIEERKAAKKEMQMCAEDEERLRAEIAHKVELRLKAKLASNTFVDYNEYNSALYLATRLVPNYAALLSVFREIKMSDRYFNPKTLFDFGSGIGTTMWAANNVWPKSLTEHFNVESSEAMIDLSRHLLQLGKEENPLQFNGIFFRQFLPVSSFIKYDLVVSAFSLLDLPSASARAHVIENLWQKTQDLLVIVEQGNVAGFAAVLEARNFILEKTGHDVTSTFHVHPEDTNVAKSDPNLQPTSHIIAPCPHHYPCPRQFTGGPVLCNFVAPYMPLDIGQEDLVVEKEYFSFVVLRKGGKETSDVPSWPRIVEQTKNRGKHVICKLCVADGRLHEITFSRSRHGRHLYRCARVSKHGDLLPVTVREVEKEVIIRRNKENREHSDDKN